MENKEDHLNDTFDGCIKPVNTFREINVIKLYLCAEYVHTVESSGKTKIDIRQNLNGSLCFVMVRVYWYREIRTFYAKIIRYVVDFTLQQGRTL